MTNNETILRQNCADLQEQLASANRRISELLAASAKQKPVAFWWIGPDGKDNGGPYRGTASEFAINNARNMGCEPQLLYAAPTPVFDMRDDYEGAREDLLIWERKRLDWALSHDAMYYEWDGAWVLCYTEDDGLTDVVETTDPRATIDELMKE